MGLQVGGSSKSESGAGTSKPLIPDDWQSQYDALLGTLGGAAGKTPEQQFGSNVFKDILSNGGVNPRLQANNDYFLSPIMQQHATTLGALNDSGNPNYKTPGVTLAPQPSGASVLNAEDVTSQDTLAKLGQYQAPVDDLISATIADMLHSGDVAQNDLRARYGGTPGGGREQVYAGQQAADTARAIGTTVGNLRLGGYQSNLGAATGDVNRGLQADQGNQGAATTRNVAQAQIDQQAAQAAADRDAQVKEFMASLLSGRQQFDVNSTLANTGQKLDAINASNNNIQTQGQNVRQQVGDYSNSGATGVDQLLATLGLGTSTFGKSTTESSKGSQVGASAGGK